MLIFVQEIGNYLAGVARGEAPLTLTFQLSEKI
jgi:hypothetical protein